MSCEVLRCCYASWTEGVVEVQDSPRRETRRYIVFMTPRNDAVMVQPCGYLTRKRVGIGVFQYSSYLDVHVRHRLVQAARG